MGRNWWKDPLRFVLEYLNKEEYKNLYSDGHFKSYKCYCVFKFNSLIFANRATITHYRSSEQKQPLFLSKKSRS
jgi:hypothetical protein